MVCVWVICLDGVLTMSKASVKLFHTSACAAVCSYLLKEDWFSVHTLALSPACACVRVRACACEDCGDGSFASQAFTVVTAGDYTSFPNVCLAASALDLCLHLSLLLWLLSPV